MRYVLVALILVVVSGCATTGWIGPPLRCDLGICVVYSVPILDSDGDGFSDEDELASGTDPFNAVSRPTTAKIAESIRAGRLPSFRVGLSEIVVLPKLLRNGTPVMPDAWLPKRKDALSSLGLTEVLLGRVGLSLDRGFRVQINSPTALPFGQSSPPTFRVGGFDWSLIASGGMSAGSQTALLDVLKKEDGGRHSGYSQITFSQFSNGGQVDVIWKNNDHSAVRVSGQRSGGETKTEYWNYPEDLSSSGTHKTTTRSTVTNSDGSKTETTKTKTEDAGSGTTTESTKVATIKQNRDGSGEFHSVETVTTKDKDGNTTQTTTTKVDASKDSDGTSIVKTETKSCPTGSDCTTTTKVETTKGYYDPELESMTHIPSQAEMSKLIAIRQGSNTTPGPSEGPIIGAWPIENYISRHDLIAHYSESEGILVLQLRPNWNRVQPRVVEDIPRPGPR